MASKQHKKLTPESPKTVAGLAAEIPSDFDGEMFSEILSRSVEEEVMHALLARGDEEWVKAYAGVKVLFYGEYDWEGLDDQPEVFHQAEYALERIVAGIKRRLGLVPEDSAEQYAVSQGFLTGLRRYEGRSS